MSDADIVSDGAKTVIANRHGCHHSRDCDSHDRGCDSGTFHLMAGHERLLKAIGDVDARAGDRAVLLVKALGDSEARQMAATNAGFVMLLKDANDNVKSILKEINDNQKANDAKLAIIQMKVCDSEKDLLKTNFENAIRVLEKVGEICGPWRYYEECGGRGGIVVSK